MQEKARAKVNLFLHITGKQADGYHTIESMVAFADDVADVITIEKSQTLSLTVQGALKDAIPEKASKDNIIYKAAQQLQKMFGIKQGASIILEKNIPIGAGLGGGSSDAAIVMQMLKKYWQLPITHQELANEGLKLGADVPVCMVQHAAWMRGIGGDVTPLKEINVPVVLVSTGIPLATKDVFQQVALQPQKREISYTEDRKMAWLMNTSNDLTAAAIGKQAGIRDILESIEKTGAWFARLSGSGASCFGLYRTSMQAEEGSKALKILYPNYHIQATTLR